MNFFALYATFVQYDFKFVVFFAVLCIISVFYFDEISERILKHVLSNGKKYVQKQFSFLDENFMDYIDYWNEKYYRNVFCLIGVCEDNNVPS